MGKISNTIPRFLVCLFTWEHLWKDLGKLGAFVERFGEEDYEFSLGHVEFQVSIE